MGWGHEQVPLGSSELEGWQQAGSKEAALVTSAMKLLAQNKMWSRRKINLALQNHLIRLQ